MPNTTHHKVPNLSTHWLLCIMQEFLTTMYFYMLHLSSFKGMRDDLTCILDDDLSSLCLCALHCKMRNTEKILKSVGLLAYEIGSLPECNEQLSKYGRDNFSGYRITVKLRHGQQTAPSRNNISFASCSGQYTLKHNKVISLNFFLDCHFC